MADDGGENIFGSKLGARRTGVELKNTGADQDMEGESVETEEEPEPTRIVFDVDTEDDYHGREGGIVKEVNTGEANADEALSPRDTGHNMPPIE